MTAGVPLVPPAGRDEDIYLLQEGCWSDMGRLSEVTVGAIAAAFPYVMDKKYRWSDSKVRHPEREVPFPPHTPAALEASRPV